MISEEIRQIAEKCRHYAMCKIDFLNTGLCPAVENNYYVSYFPQGRMDLYNALAKDLIPVTEGLVDIADSCNLCGICDKQCYFVTELRPLKVMQALKEFVDHYKKSGKEIQKIDKDEFIQAISQIVGEQWITNDPAHLVTYADDPCPLSPMTMPRYVILPGSTEEISAVVKMCNRFNLHCAVRGNGSSVMGFVMSKDVIIDMQRLKKIILDAENWKVTVGAGISAFELQKAVHKHGFRVNVAEPSALVCANLMCSGIFSTFSHAYGIAADNYVDAEFVDPTGEIFTLNQRNAPNLFSFQKVESPRPGICTEVSIKLHPVTDDEEGVLVPFSDFRKALEFSRELSVRRIGLAVGVLGSEYISTFMAPSVEVANKLKAILPEKLGIHYLVTVIGDHYAIKTVRKMAKSVIDNELFKVLLLGLPGLMKDEWLDFIESSEGDRIPFEMIADKKMLPLIETALSPSPENFAQLVPEDLRDFYRTLYARPEMTDMIWLSMFRIISSRMGRRKHVFAFVVYTPLDKVELLEKLKSEFKAIADKFAIDHDYGFITPLDLGKRAVFEYDYYLDHTDADEISRCRDAVLEAAGMIESYSAEIVGVRWIKYVLYQGFCRSENLLYT